jgi:hypothetical protein
MICRTEVQDRLQIRRDVLVELPFKNSGLLLRLGAFPTCKSSRLAQRCAGGRVRVGERPAAEEPGPISLRR